MTITPMRFGAATAGSQPPPALPVAEPLAPRSHVWRRVVMSVVVVIAVVGALLGGRAWGEHGRYQVWSLRVGLASGATVEPNDLRAITVTGSAASSFVAATSSVVGRTVNRSVPAGAGLPTVALGGVSRFPAAGQELVGVALPAGTAPGGLVAGSIVSLLALPASSPGGRPPVATSQVVLPTVEVVAVTTSSDAVVATLLAPVRNVPELVALSSQQRVALSLISS